MEAQIENNDTLIQEYKFIDELKTISKNAGQAILEVYETYKHSHLSEKKNFVNYKSDKSPVTSADLISNKIIIEALQVLTPAIPVVSEEDQNSWEYRNANSLFWIIDPLDGTKEFLKCTGEFTVNIGLIQNGVSIFGMIYVPVSQELFWGSAKIGAFKEMQDKIIQLQVFDFKDQTEVRVIASRSHLNSQTQDFINKLKYPSKIIGAGSSLKFCRIAENKADLYPRFGPTCEWDTAAGQSILEGAGGLVVQENAERLLYGKADKLNPYFIACNTLFQNFIS